MTANPTLDAVTRCAEVLTTPLRTTDGPWIGARYGAREGVLELGALGPGLYDGLAGVAYFLTVLGDQPSSPVDARELTAESFRRLEDVVSDYWLRETSIGLVGLGGVSFAAVQRLQQADDRAAAAVLRSTASALVARCGRRNRLRAVDVVAGEAGALLALCNAIESDVIERGPLEGAARQLVDLLVDAAEPAAPAGRSWSRFEPPQHPVGLGHGSTGVAWALHRSAEVVGHRRDAIDALVDDVVAFEDAAMEPVLRTWLDPRPGADPGTAILNGWCWGAVGVRLARWAMGRAAPADCLRPEDLRDGPDHLCCGAAGALELAAVTDAAAAERLSRRLAERVLDGTVAVDTTPGAAASQLTSSTSLFRGLPGIACALLRSTGSAVLPSALLLR